MKKQNIIKENYEYTRIIKSNKPFKYKQFIIYCEKNDINNRYEFGISVGKKIGNAVLRNRIKRQIKSIIDKKNYQNGIKCIIIVNRGILELNYSMMCENLLSALNKLNIIKEK